MNMRSPKINLDKLTSLSGQIIEKLKKAEDNEYFLIIGNSGLRDKNNKISYIMGKEMDTQMTSSLIHPEIHKTKEGISFCECPDFYYFARTKEEKLSQAMSLEIAAKMAKKIQGIIIVINHSDLYTTRGAAYKDLIKTLGELFASNFEELFKCACFLITNKPKHLDKSDFLESINADVNMLKEILAEEDLLEQGEELVKAKMEFEFSNLIISHANQVSMLDESDNGESRKIFLESLSKISPIEFDKFEFENLYVNILKGFDFNIRKYVDETLSKTSSNEFRKVI